MSDIDNNARNNQQQHTEKKISESLQKSEGKN